MINKKIFIIGMAALVVLTLTMDGVLFFKYRQKKDGEICKNCNVILISLDTLGSAHLPCYGYERETAPNLCKFGKDNILFTNSYSNSHWTLPSHFSIFTSLYPTTHGVQQILKDKLNIKHKTLAQIFQENGYQTIYAGPEDDPYLPLEFGIAKGFSEQIKVPTITDKNIEFWDRAIEMLKKNNAEKKPSFLFLHTYAVHDPYIPGDKDEYRFVKEPRELIPKDINQYYYYSADRIEKMIAFFEERIKNSDTPQSLEINTKTLETIKRFTGSDIKNYTELDNYLNTIFPEEKFSIFRKIYEKDLVSRIDFYRDLHDESIYNLDSQITKILDLTNDGQLSKNTIILITSDHGESFWEHNQYGHTEGCSNCLYNEVIKVPWIMYTPGIRSKEINSLVQGIDILPTLTDLVGIRKPAYIDGKSMLGQIYSKKTAIKNKYVIAESNLEFPQKAIIDERWKLIWKYEEKENNVSLFDLKNDPLEKTNLAEENKKIVDDKLQILKKFMKRPNIDKLNSQTKFPDWVDKTKRERLTKGGYF